MTGASFVPVSGVRPSTALDHRALMRPGVVHAVPVSEGEELTASLTAVHVTACGRMLVALATYGAADWPKLRDRDHKRYQTGVCARCAKLTRPAELEGVTA